MHSQPASYLSLITHILDICAYSDISLRPDRAWPRNERHRNSRLLVFRGTDLRPVATKTILHLKFLHEAYYVQ